MLLFLVTPLLIVAVQPCMKWMSIERNRLLLLNLPQTNFLAVAYDSSHFWGKYLFWPFLFNRELKILKQLNELMEFPRKCPKVIIQYLIFFSVHFFNVIQGLFKLLFNINALKYLTEIRDIFKHFKLLFLKAKIEFKA